MVTAADLRRLRSDSLSLVTLAMRDLEALLRSADAQAVTALRDVLPALIDTYGAAAATLAADWYDDVREEAGVPQRFTAIPVEIADAGAQALIGWAVSEATDDASFRALIQGGTQRRIVNYSRGTITGTAVADPSAQGWQRVGIGECEFCDMLIGRGAVYSKATVDFGAHDNCNCQAAPAFTGQPTPVKPYTPSLRNASDADRARVRDWIESNL